MKIKDIRLQLKDVFTIKKQLGSGGNATVYEAVELCSDKLVALKILIPSEETEFVEKKARFLIETKKVLELCTNISGIIPVDTYCLPAENNQLCWYTMPVAVSVNDYLKDKYNITSIITCVINLSETLEKLHDLDIVHRDIKPSNLYYYNCNYCFADFGLVDYPEKDDLTRTDEQIGAKATIAPEMKRDSKHADGKAADVYSLSKTLWMLLMKSKYGFDGVYVADSSVMGLSHRFPKEHLVELDKLLTDSTSDVPEDRPNITRFRERLQNYLEIYSDFDRTNQSEWMAVQEELFHGYYPESIKWSQLDQIRRVLNLLGKYPSLNHTFFPTGGGNDLTSSVLAAESGCLEMHFGSSIIIVSTEQTPFCKRPGIEQGNREEDAKGYAEFSLNSARQQTWRCCEKWYSPASS